MEGKFFIETGQFTNGGASVESHDHQMDTKAQDSEGDSDDDEEETRKFRRHSHSTDGTDCDTGSEKENSPQPPNDSGIDSFLLLETGTPASEDNDDDEGDQAFRPVVFSKMRRGSRGREARRPESNGSSDSKAASETVNLASERNKSDDAAPETNKQKKRRKRNKKRAAEETPTDRPSTDDWDQLDLLEDDFRKVEDLGKIEDLGEVEEDIEQDGEDVGRGPKPLKASSPEKSKKIKSETDSDITEKKEPPVNPKDKGDFFVAGKLPNGSHNRSESESTDSKAGIKSILKNSRSRTFSGESSCSDAVELGSSCGGRSGGYRSRNQSTTSLTDVTQSMESLSITSMLTSDSCCEDGHDDKCDNSQYCASSWSAGGTRKSVHFSAVIDRKRFRSGAPPVNIGKGRRCSTGKANANQSEHGKKRHMSEGDAGTAHSREDGTRIFDRGGSGMKNVEAGDGRADSPNDLLSASSDDLFEMEELNEENGGNCCGKGSFKLNVVSPLLVGVPEEVEDQEVASESESRRVKSESESESESRTKTKKGKKSKSKKGKGKGPNSSELPPSSDFDEVQEGWSIVGSAKLGWKKGGSKNSSDLSLSSDVDDGHSIYATEGVSEFGAISITNGLKDCKSHK